jgi:hypothetical protein
MNIGQEILVLRAEKGWTQKQFADKLKTSQRTIAAWEAGNSIPRKTMMVKIAQVFGLPSNIFLDSEVSKSENERIESNEKNNYKLHKKNDIKGIESVVLNAYQEMSEENKNQFIETVKEILNNIEKN